MRTPAAAVFAVGAGVAVLDAPAGREAVVVDDSVCAFHGQLRYLDACIQLIVVRIECERGEDGGDER